MSPKAEVVAMNKSAALHVLLLVVCLFSLLFPACVTLKGNSSQQGQSTLSEVSTATSVSPDGQPLAVSSTFLATTPTIYATAKLTKAPEDTTVGVKWVYVSDDSGHPLNQQLSEDSTTATGTRYVSFSRQPAGGAWGAGRYSVSFLINGNEVSNAEFTVQAVQTTGAQAPTITFFKAVPEAISTGQAVTLSWSVTDATQVQISTIGSVAPVGNVIVTPVNSVEYSLTATNSAGSTSMKANITVTSFNSDKPDLVITDFHIDGDKAYYKIKNIGGAFAKQSTTILYVQGMKRASSLVDILAPGEERQQYFPNYSWTFGSGRSFNIPIRVCADALDQIGEYDKNNNCLVLDW